MVVVMVDQPMILLILVVVVVEVMQDLQVVEVEMGDNLMYLHHMEP